MIFGPWIKADFQIPVYIYILNTYQSKLVIKIDLFCDYEYIYKINHAATSQPVTSSPPCPTTQLQSIPQDPKSQGR